MGHRGRIVREVTAATFGDSVRLTQLHDEDPFKE